MGAQPSETVGNLLRRAMIIDTPAVPRFQQPQEGGGGGEGEEEKVGACLMSHT